ncbi:MAG TPA: MerR family transcriptional regulator [Thermoanaerobaculia bacterium]|jgi:DNA-binding transcriptional MerR regulator
MNEARFKIGDLAKRTGVTIRTLHHYDEIGLLVPPHRTESGHRLYGTEEVLRLQQILSLRQMGFSLDQIGTMLGSPDYDARRVIELHISRLRQQIAWQQELCMRLEAVAAHYPSVTAGEIIKTIEVMTMFEKYYTKEQLDTLAKRREQLGEARMQQAAEEWPRLMKQVREEMQRGTDPKDPRVVALAKQWRALIDEFTGGDPGIEQSLRNFYQGESKFAEQQGVDNSINEYIGKALA